MWLFVAQSRSISRLTQEELETTFETSRVGRVIGTRAVGGVGDARETNGKGKRQRGLQPVARSGVGTKKAQGNQVDGEGVAEVTVW